MSIGRRRSRPSHVVVSMTERDGNDAVTAYQELTGLAREHGWEVGEYPAYVEVRKTGFIRASVQVRVEWTDRGSVARAERIAPGQAQVVLDRTDQDKRAAVASWFTDGTLTE